MHLFRIVVRSASVGHRVEATVVDESTSTDTPAGCLLDLTGVPPAPPSARDVDAARGFGEALGRAVFAGDVRTAFHSALDSAVASKQTLHVKLEVEPAPVLAPLRWELLCSPTDKWTASPWEFLRLQQQTPFSLCPPATGGRRYPLLSREDLRALLVVANMGPSTGVLSLPEFDAAATVDALRAVFTEQSIGCTVLACNGATPVPGADGLPTLEEICKRLDTDAPSILHVVCHGAPARARSGGRDGAPDDTILYLLRGERPRGRYDARLAGDHVAQVLGRELSECFRRTRRLPHLTFLCSCESAAPTTDGWRGGLAQRLSREFGMPAVLAMTEPIAIRTGQALCKEFYSLLRRDGEVDRALNDACVSLVHGHDHDVLVPVLFDRLRGLQLFGYSGELTTGEWNAGLERLENALARHAPVLLERSRELIKNARTELAVVEESAQIRP